MTVAAFIAMPHRYGRQWWLPTGGIGNGLDADAWAPILEVDARIVAPLLDALAAAGVAAYAAHAEPTANRLRRHPRAWPPSRIWVDSGRYATAEKRPAVADGRPGRAGGP